MGTSKKLSKRQVKLTLPGYIKKESRLRSIKALENKSRDLRHFPVQILTEILLYLQEFNRSKQSSARQYELIERCAIVIVPIVNSVYSRFYNVHPLPEDEEKRELLAQASSVCNEMAIGFMRLFEHDINLSLLRYNRSRNRIAHCAHRVMDIVYAEQRLRALRYQDLSADTWRNVNLIFTAVYCFEDTHFQKESLGILDLSSSGTQNIKNPPIKSRILSMYISIQLNGCVDMFSMATQQSHIAAKKVQKYADKLSVSENLELSVPEDHIITHSKNSDASNGDTPVGSAMEFSIDVSHFKKKIQFELKKTDDLLVATDSSSNETEESTRLAGRVTINQDDLELWITLTKILHRLSPHDRSEERRYLGHMDPLFIINGYKPCFDIMSQLRQSKFQSDYIKAPDTGVRDMLSQRSATIADDHTCNESSQWLISNSSSNGVLAETRETRFTHNMFVGQLLVYGVGDISSGEFTLAYIGRMHRDMGDKLQIALINISKQAEIVVVQSAFLKKSALGLPAILLADYDDGLGLVLHTSHRLGAGTSITVTRSNKPYQYCLGSAKMIQREFTLYQLVSA